jgi:hypothetical protein
MWVRKSNQEIEAQRKSLWLFFRGPLIWSVIIFFCGLAVSIQGPSVGGGTWFSNWADVLKYTTKFSFFIAIVLYVLQLVFQWRIDPLVLGSKAVICNKCHEFQKASNEFNCKCGGKFEDFDNWKWIDE